MYNIVGEILFPELIDNKWVLNLIGRKLICYDAMICEAFRASSCLLGEFTKSN